MAEKRLGFVVSAKSSVGRTVRQIGRELKDLGGYARTAGSAIWSALKWTVGAFTGISAVAGVALRYYAQQEEAEQRLSSALRARGDDYEKLMPRMKAFASAMQEQTTVGDEAILSAMAYARALGLPAKVLEQTTKAAIGLSAVTGDDLTSSIDKMVRAFGGQLRAVDRALLGIKEGEKGNAAFNKAVQAGTRFLRIEQDQARTFGGQLKQLRNAFGDAMEELGGSINRGLDLPRRLREWTAKLVEWGPQIGKAVEPYIRRIGDSLDAVFSGDPKKRAAGIADFGNMLSAAGAAVKPYFVQWGREIGGAIWDGFKGASVAGAMKLEKPGLNVQRGLGYNPMIGAPLAAMRGGFAALGAERGQKLEAFASAVSDSMPQNVLNGLGTSSNPLHVREVRPIDGVQPR